MNKKSLLKVTPPCRAEQRVHLAVYFILFALGLIIYSPKALAGKSFLQSFPNLRKYVYKPPSSGFYLGLGVSPVGILRDRFVFSADFFSVHYIDHNWDWELLNASYGVTRAQPSELGSTSFIFRSTIKFRVTRVISGGPLIGYEYISFPQVGSRIYRSPYATPDEPFSSEGPIYGGMVSETYRLKKNYLLQISEIAFQETYSVTKTAQNWNYLYDDPILNANPQLIGASTVTMIEVSFLY